VSRPLEPNTDYVESSTGYVFTTDAAGKVCRVQGKLLDEVGHRNTYQQRKIGRPDRLPTDDGAHFMATIFRGPGEAINLTAMDANLNRGAWKALENDWAQALRQGKEVSVVIEVKYPQDGGRAERFIVAYQITGEPPRRRVFKNARGGQ
jgi:filamentous hemagglutinin